MPQSRRQSVASAEQITSRLSYDSRTNRYRSRNGQFVTRQAVRDESHRVADAVSQRLVAVSEQLRAGEITLPQWTLRMREEIKAGHSLNYILARGGRSQMSAADWGRVGRLTRFHFEALNRFASQIEAGGMVHLGRVRMYAAAISNTYENAQRGLRLQDAEHVPYANWVLTAKESCAGCIEQAGRGAQKLTEFPAIGSQECAANCRCFLDIIPNPLGF